MILSQQQLTLLLNAFYELGEQTITVKHPSSEIGELFRIDLADPASSTVSVTTGAASYEERLEVMERKYGSQLRDELPNRPAYVKSFVASGLADIRNRDEVDKIINRYGYQDLQAGHPPRYAGFDTNLLPWRMHDTLSVDPEHYSDEAGRTPVNGYTLPAGVDEELRISYRYGKNAMEAEQLAAVLGSEFERLTGQPTQDNRETRLGLREYRRLRETRPHDIVASERGDKAIIDGCMEYYQDEPTGVILFSNDYGFIDEARDRKIPAVHVDFDVDVRQKLTGSWEQIATLLYVFAITFGVVILPKVTLYGVWESKSAQHWRREQLDIDARSAKIESLLNRDKPIVEAYRDIR